MSATKNEKPGLLSRRAAISLLQGVTLDQQPLDQLLETNTEFRLLEGRDRSFAHALVASSLRHGGEIKAVLGKFLTKPLPRSSGMAVDILTIAAAQLLFMDVSPHAAIDLSVDLAKQDKKAQHFSGLINAVLRKVATDGKAALEKLDGARLNTPDWLWEQWVAAYGEQAARDIAVSHLTEAPLDISVKNKPEYWAEHLKGELLPDRNHKAWIRRKEFAGPAGLCRRRMVGAGRCISLARKTSGRHRGEVGARPLCGTRRKNRPVRIRRSHCDRR